MLRYRYLPLYYLKVCLPITILFFLLLITGCTNVTVELQQAEQLMDIHPDSSLKILQKINPTSLKPGSDKALYALLLSQAQDKNDIVIESDSLISIATKYYNENDPDHAGYAWFYTSRIANNQGDASARADAILKAKDFINNSQNHYLKGLVYAETADMYSVERNYDSSFIYHKLSYKEFCKIKDTQNCSLSLIYMAFCYMKNYRTDSALTCLYEAEKLSKQIKDTVLLSTIYRTLGSIYLKNKAYDKSIEAFELVPLTKQPLLNSNKWFLLANACKEAGKFELAQKYLAMMTEMGEMTAQYYWLQQFLCKQSGDYITALNFAEKARWASDSLQSRKLDISFAGLEKKYKYQGLQLANQKLLVTQKQNRIWLLTLIIILSSGLIIVLSWNNNVKNKQLKLNKTIIEKEKENNQLLEKQLQFHNILLLNVENYRRQSIQRPENVKNTLKITENRTFHEELIACMDLQFNNISQRLIYSFPDLTNRDILICCLLLANFETGMIATILDVKNDSVRIHRTRLRKKLHLQNHENIIEFLSRF